MQIAPRLLPVVSLASLIGIGCVPAAGSGGAAAASQPAGVAGTYRAEVEGESYVLVLETNGSGTINGEPGTWQMQYGQLVLSDGQETVLATLQGQNIVVQTPEGQLVFVRQAAPARPPGAPRAPGVATPGPAKPFEPTDTLAGEVIAPAGTGAELTVPDGWTHAPRRDADGSEVYAISSEGGGAEIIISRRALSPADAAQRPSMLLQQVLQELLAGHPTTPVLAAEDLTIAGQPAARTIVRAQRNGQELELYLAGVVAHGYGFLIASMYPANTSGTIRPAFDTVLSTFRGSAPPENAALRAQLIGCWQQYSGNTDRSGSTSSSQKLGLQADGTYWWRSRTHINAEGAGSMSSKASDQGRFRVEGDTVVTVGDNGETGSYRVALQGGFLFVNGEKYMSCGR